MYDQKLVKKRKRRIGALIGTSISMAGVGALVIVAFLGRFVGTFTVSLNNENVEISLSETKAFDDPTSFLMIDALPPYGEYTYSKIIDEKETVLDSEETTYLSGCKIDAETGNLIETQYFKYTFFVKNTGTVTAKYDFHLNILENTLSDDGRSLLDTLRVMVYENDANTDEHNKLGDKELNPNHQVFARRAYQGNYIGDKKVWNEYIAYSAKGEADQQAYGLADLFESEQRITTSSVRNFEKDDIKRYTIVTWLEGSDPSSASDSSAPKGATLKLGVEINAYENE